MSHGPRAPNVFPSTSHPSTSFQSNTTSSLRSSAATSHSQSVLQARIASKRAELENLRQLRDLSANLASQLAALEGKLTTLKDGAQSVALVLANWDNVLRAIGMAAMKVPKPPDVDAENAETVTASKTETTQELPVPLVRIPLQPKVEEGG